MSYFILINKKASNQGFNADTHILTLHKKTRLLPSCEQSNFEPLISFLAVETRLLPPSKKKEKIILRIKPIKQFHINKWHLL